VLKVRAHDVQINDNLIHSSEEFFENMWPLNKCKGYK
jgi:hypothetical protein